MKKSILFSLVIFLVAMNSYSAIWRVNNMPNSGAHFTTLASAIEAAATDDIIYVEGTGVLYNESYITLTKKLSIYGPGYYLSDNESTQANHFPAEFFMYLTFDVGSEGSLISGLSIVQGYVYVFTSNITIERCFIDVEFRISGSDQHCSNFLLKQSYLGSGMWVWGMENPSTNIVITNNIFAGSLSLWSENGSYTVRNNVFVDSYDNIQSYNAIIENNIVGGKIESTAATFNSVHNNIIGTNNEPEGGTNNLINIDLTTVFVDYPNGTNTSPDAMFTLKTGSVAIGFGVDGVDCGLFDGDFPYILSGLPPLPRIYEAIIGGQGTIDGLQVTIKAKSQQ